MGSILPHAINTGGSAPVSTTSQQPRIGPFGIGDLLQTAGDVMVQLGGSNEAVARLAARRVQEQQQDIERQRYAASLQQQRFMNNLASHRDRLADQEYQLRRAALMNRTGGGGGAASMFGDSPQAQSPTSSMLSNIQGSSAVPIPRPAPNDHGPGFPDTPGTAESIGYDTSPIIDPAKFSPELRAKFDGLKANDPHMYDNVINVANYGALEDDVLKGIQNPRDRINFSRAVRAANPSFDPKVAGVIRQFEIDKNNPKSPTSVMFKQGLDLSNVLARQIENAKRLPSLGFKWGTKALDLANEAFSARSVTDYDQLGDDVYKGVESGRLHGKPTTYAVKSLQPLYDKSLGPNALARAHELLADENDARIYDNIYDAAVATKGFGGYKTYDLTPQVVKRFVKKGYLMVGRNGLLRPLKRPNS